MGIGTFGLIATRHCGDLDARRRRKTGEDGRKARQLAENNALRAVRLGIIVSDRVQEVGGMLPGKGEGWGRRKRCGELFRAGT